MPNKYGKFLSVPEQSIKVFKENQMMKLVHTKFARCPTWMVVEIQASYFQLPIIQHVYNAQ